jgi:transcriptional regulator with XRE-family HTH domain
MNEHDIPRPVVSSMRDLGENLATWRKLRKLTVVQLADRAGVSVATISRTEAGKGCTVESLFRISRALGILKEVSTVTDPFNSDVGRLRADNALPQRVRN